MNEQGRIDPPKLPVARVIVTALWHCWKSSRAILAVMVLPALVVALVTFLMFRSSALPDAPVRWVARGIQVFVLIFAAVSCHRVILLGPESVPRWGVTGWHRREWGFVLLALIVGIASTASSLAGGIAASIVLMIPVNLLDVASQSWMIWCTEASTLIVGAYVMGRLSLALPAMAVDEPINLRDAWRLSSGNAVRLMVLVAVIPWLLRFAESQLAAMFQSPADYWTVSTALYLLLTPLEIALLSVSYRALRPAA
ncbi:hypothetical protein HNQ60_001952 [Povalibacter uvarum]|uniref:Uncharacterized protein n=1 Tax=Povalibacter uvarum TaxID=732238 RepID=A0A841HKH2_9GAMM|nr:hypothetical protein [Povalibacter uvarum]MBB6093074.1 hypothetical protein [Povalibacter uvarum]